MANQRTDTDSVINLVINGKQAMASFKELTDAQRKLNAEVKNMKPNDPGYDKQAEKLKALNTALRDQRLVLNAINKETEEVATKWEKIAQVAAGNMLADAFDSVLSALSEFKNGAEAAFVESELGAAQLQAVLKSTGAVAGKTKEQLDDLASSTMAITAVDDDVITKAESLLLTFTNIRGEIFDQTIPALVDMTAALNGGDVSMQNIQATTMQVGKALNDPIKGMTTLRKVGVSFTEDQVKTVKSMLATNNIAGAQGIILAELGKEFGNVAAAQAATESGIKRGFEVRLGNIQELLGGFITRMKVATMQGWAPFLEKVERWISIPVADKLQEEQSELNGLVSAIVITNDNQAVRNSLITQLQAKYPDFIGKINQETASNELLTRRLVEVNDQYRQRIFIGANEDKIKYIQEKRNQAIREEAAARTAVAKASGLSAMQLAALTDAQIKQLAVQQRDKALRADAARSGGNAYSSGTSNTRNQEIENLDLILNGRSRIAASFKEEADLMGANKIMQQKVTDQRVKDIDLEIAKLKLLKSANADQDIARLKAEKNGLLGIAAPAVVTASAGPSKQAMSLQEKAKKDFETLNEDYKKLTADRLIDQLAKNQKEIAQEGVKYDDLVKKEQDFIKQKGTTAAQVKASEAKIVQLNLDKKTAQDNLAVRQEKVLTDDIAALREKLGNKYENELVKEKDLINKFYDDQEIAFKGNDTALASLKLARTKELSDAEIREKKRLEDEKLKITSESDTLTANTQAAKLANIKKQYDDEIEELKKKFSKELQETQAFKDAVAAIEANRSAAVKGTKETDPDKEEKEKKDAIIQSTQAISDAVFTIGANNRKRESDLKISALDRERDSELSNKKLSEKQKADINAKYDKKIKDEKLKAWKADKQAALEQGVINGALAVIKALPNIPLAIATGVASAAQLAVIVASEPPEFYTGVENFKGGKAVVGDRGPEIVNENGKVWLADKPMLVDLENGTDVYDAAKTSTMLKGRSLGDSLYSTSNYSIDNGAVRSAERNYRSAGSGNYTSTSTAAASLSSGSSASHPDITRLANSVAQLHDAVKVINERTVKLYYQELEDFGDNVNKVRIAQKG